MGAKQSKRSVDISGKEAEGGGEVAVAGAGGEGRLEPLTDADALKPQLNGEAHIQTEQTDKEKELDSGTPENEKDATTEKEGKEENDKETEEVPVANGESEEKIENGESTPAPEDGKKPKKEKVKKKWSLRSISFSRKDKPKQEKKQKDEEAKTNGEPEKVPEETAEATAAAEPAPVEVASEASALSPAPAPASAPAPAPEVKEQQTPETPVTEPLSNGTGASSPSPAASPAEEAPALASPAIPEPATQPEPEQLPVNGLSLEEPKPEVPEEKTEETKPDPSPAAETVEIAPAPEIPVKEVCVQQMPLLESTPPPLPANPPPSSVASFAASTMAPELSAASIPDTADTAPRIEPLPNTTTTIDQTQSQPLTSESDATELPSPLKETIEGIQLVADAIEPQLRTEVIAVLAKVNVPVPSEVQAVPHAESVEVEDIPMVTEDQNELSQVEEIKEQGDKIVDTIEVISERIPTDAPVTESSPELKIEQIPEPEITTSEIDDTPLPPPPAQDDFEMETNLEHVDQNSDDDIKVIPEPITEPEKIIEANHVSVLELTNGVDETSLKVNSLTAAENAKNIAKVIAVTVTEKDVKMECNGEAGDSNVSDKELTNSQVVGSEVTCENGVAGYAPPPPAAPPAPAAHTPQEPVSVSDKLADLIPEVPDVPEINTETLQETATDMAVAN